MSIIETKINRFDGGITNDPRDPAGNVGRMISNFDILSFSHKMIPYRNTESGDNNASTRKKRNFLIGLKTGTTYSLYGLGVASGQEYAGIEYKNLSVDTGGMSDDTWTAAGGSTAGAPNFNLWVYYRKKGLAYFARAGTHYGAYTVSSGTLQSDTHQAATYTEITQGIVHSKDDILYIGRYNNAGGAGEKSFIDKNANGSWTVPALTLPDHLIPTSICEYGNYLAIGCAPASGIGNSRIFLWDRNEAATTLAESVDAGSGSLMILEEIDGELIWISQVGGASVQSTHGIGFSTLPNQTTSHRDRVIFRRLIGNAGVKFFELRADRAGGVNTTLLPPYKQKVDNRLFFQMIIQYNGSVRDGVWSIGRSPGQQFVLVQEQKSNNNTALTVADTVNGFIKVGDFLMQAYTSGGAGATYNVSKTVVVTDGNFSENSIYETKTFNAGDSSVYKDLIEVAVQTEPMVANGQIILAYQIDENIGTSTWTTIFTNTTNDSISHTANNIEASGAFLPKQYKEIAFRILSTGGAEVTGLTFREQITGRKHIAD